MQPQHGHGHGQALRGVGGRGGQGRNAREYRRAAPQLELASAELHQHDDPHSHRHGRLLRRRRTCTGSSPEGVLRRAVRGDETAVNKLQPSQLAEEQRNATRLFKQLHEDIQTALILTNLITEQYHNWNSFLLTSINMMTLTATAMVGLSAAAAFALVLPLKASSAGLFASMTTAVNKLQPSQLAEEQCNATRLFKQLHEEIQTMLILTDLITELHRNWNSLLLNSINMMTLTATAMAGLSTAATHAPVLPLKASSVGLFEAMTVAVNKLQPSQLAEEQRNATRLFKQLHEEIQTALILTDLITETNVASAMERVLALHRAYPLPLIGAMLEKFPVELEAAVWWPPLKNSENGGWRKEEMRDIARGLKEKDKQDYLKLGNTALGKNSSLCRMFSSLLNDF